MKKHSWNNGRWFNEDGIVMREDTCKKCGCQRTVYLKEHETESPFLIEWVGGYTMDLIPSIARPDCIELISK